MFIMFITHMHDVSGRDDVATNEDIFGNVAESKSLAQTQFQR